MKRHRFKRDKAVGERLIKEARLARERAHQLPPGAQRTQRGHRELDALDPQRTSPVSREADQ